MVDFEKIVPRDILDDLCCRFVINVPEEERKDMNRIFFQIENAHWFYIDFYSKNFPNRKPCALREFAQQVFNHIPFLQPFSGNLDAIFEEWKEYKFCVPTFGAILLDEELSHILLVQNYRSSWGFPKGKVNKDEPPYQCAIREVYEETGFDIAHLIDTNDYLESNVNKQIIRLYIIPGVKKGEKFVPKTRNEIKAINWFPICDLPLNKKEAILKQLKTGNGANTFYMVSPFLKKIRQWIYDYNTKPRRLYSRQRHKSCSDIDHVRHRENNFDLKDGIGKLQKKKESKTEYKGSNITEGNFDNPEVDTIPIKLASNNCHISLHSGLLEGNAARSEGQSTNLEPKPLLPAICETPHSSVVKFLPNSSKNNTIESKIPMNFLNSRSLNLPAISHFNILSDASAFKVVDSSKKLNVSRENTNAQWGEGCSLPNGVQNDDGNSSFISLQEGVENEIRPLEFKPIECIAAWSNFKFDMNAILKSMDEAVQRNHKEGINIKR